ncbi:PycA protein [Rhizodiscina lignyota]|uniref:PycA protein n=1 Tax=Rhizodiscina lignyota TaxID=1504668 RepID=A0A9P4I9W0_9PEZI|nr:PycA protein [Rhizodiscina lignyota]
MVQHHTRPIKRLLVANRGEIAVRIISAARELDIETYAVYTADDITHAKGAAHALKLKSPTSFMNIDELIQQVKNNNIDAVHPGYGFLSESAEFARRMWDEAGCVVIGPGAEVLERTGDKLKAKMLAEECGVPTLKALTTPTNNIEDLKVFADRVGYPIMVKAVDGGGGRGIRLIRSEDQLQPSAKRAIEESPSKQVFAEKAAVDGFRHVEVQIAGDCQGNVQHVWERECSIQRRYQKVVELAPSQMGNRPLAAKIIQAALSMARKIDYFSLGTFEFLANPQSSEFYFLEINPRLQVEHTITESIAMLDLVQIQLLLAQGHPISSTALSSTSGDPLQPPSRCSIQLRITAENLHADWSLSIGKITSFSFPIGNGIRIDTHLLNGHPAVVGPDFDSLLAKIIVTAATWEDAVKKAKRALQDTEIEGVKTNIDILRGIVAHPDFLAGSCDTTWLEATQVELLKAGEVIAHSTPSSLLELSMPSTSSSAVAGAGSSIFRKGDAWSLTLSPPGTAKPALGTPSAHLLLTKVLRNEFPSAMAAEIEYTPASTDAAKATSQSYTLHLASTTASASATTSTHRRGNPGNPSHIVIPFSGKLVEVLIGEGDILRKGDVVCVVQQMKMELEVRASRAGRVTWVTEAEDGEEVGEGTLAAEIEVLDEEKGVAAKL